MGLGPPRGHLVYWRRQIVPQPGRSAGGLSPESSPRSGAKGRPGCLGSALRLTQCCQSNPEEQRMAGRLKEWEMERGERTEEGETLYHVSDLLPANYQPRLTVENLWPLRLFWPLITQWKYETTETVDLDHATGLVITRNSVCIGVCVWTRVCTSIIKACNPFSCLADPEEMLFPWQCQVVFLHYSWACTPAPVQGLSPCSNAIFIKHTHTQTEKARGDCSWERDWW